MHVGLIITDSQAKRRDGKRLVDLAAALAEGLGWECLGLLTTAYVSFMAACDSLCTYRERERTFKGTLADLTKVLTDGGRKRSVPFKCSNWKRKSYKMEERTILK